MFVIWLTLMTLITPVTSSNTTTISPAPYVPTEFKVIPAESQCTKGKLICDTVYRFRKLCPFTDVCTHEFDVTNDATFLGPPCCEPCDCGDDCGTECCPDKPTNYLNSSEIQARKMIQCIVPRYKKEEVDGYTVKAFEMIATCPVGYTDADIGVACLRDYFEFDFGENVINLMPVTSKTSLKAFKNRHCALCHGEVDTDLIKWNTVFQCFNGPPVIKSLNDIPNVLEKRYDCNIAFSVPGSLSYTECGNIIDTCNVTGAWRDFDPNIESACMSYKSTYNGYKNVHCFLCNGNSVNDIEFNCYKETDAKRTSSSFLALLDFNNLENTVEVSEKDDGSCQIGERYDELMKKCRPMSCSIGMFEREGKCVQIYKSFYGEEPATYEISLSLSPAKLIDDNMEIQSPTELCENIQTYMMPSQYRRNMQICDIQTSVHLKQSVNATLSAMIFSERSLMYSDIRFIGLTIIINIHNTGENVTSTIETLEIFLQELLHIDPVLVANYTVRSRRVSRTLFDNAGTSQPIPVEPSKDLDNLTSRIQMPIWLLYGLTYGFDEASDKTGILPMISIMSKREKCEGIISIEPESVCPKVKLSSDDINIEVDKTRIYISNIDSYINSSNVTFEDNENNIWVCSDAYFSLVDKYVSVHSKEMTDNETLFNTLSILTIVCLSLSIIALIITFTIYCVLGELRTLPGKNNMSLVFCLFLSQALTLVNTCAYITLPWLCKAIGLVLHVSLLSSAFWMFVCTFHIMYVFLIRNLPSSSSQTRRFVYYVLLVAIPTVLLVTITATVSFLTTEPSDIGYGGMPCYIKNSDIILYTVAVPIGLVVVANIIMFLCVVVKISRLPDIHGNSTVERNNITIFAKLSTITGLTWVFGFIYQFSNMEVFAYIFIFLNAGQGIFIMFSFVINKRVLDMLRKKKRDKQPNKLVPGKAIVLNEKMNYRTGDSSSSNTKSLPTTTHTL